MRNEFAFLFFSTLLSAALCAAHCAQAQTRVGEAVVVKNEVVRVAGSATARSMSATAVLRDETVRTGADSAARLVMADSTNLSLGANSSLKLDRTVFNDEHSYREIAIRLTTGAFRFVTGHSEKTAYKITTPLATIGVRGTTLDILSQRGRPSWCCRTAPRRVCTHDFQCIELTQPGDTAIITSAGGKVTIKKTNTPPWTFAANCAAARRAVHRHPICGRLADDHARRSARSHRHAVRALTMAKLDRRWLVLAAMLAAARCVALLRVQYASGRSADVLRRPDASTPTRPHPSPTSPRLLRSPTPPHRRRRARRRAADARPARPARIPARGSINDLANQRFNQMITNRVLGTVLLGVNEQVNCSDCVSAFGSAGSFSAGIHGRKELTHNLSLLAGIAYTQYSEGGYNVTSAPIGAFALRYDFTDWGSSRPFFDIGTILTP